MEFTNITVFKKNLSNKDDSIFYSQLNESKKKPKNSKTIRLKCLAESTCYNEEFVFYLKYKNNALTIKLDDNVFAGSESQRLLKWHKDVLKKLGIKNPIKSAYKDKTYVEIFEEGVIDIEESKDL